MQCELSRKVSLIVASLSLFFLTACAALETHRNVFVNGQKQNAFSAAVFDAQTGMYMPDGHYWMDPWTSTWGVEGNRRPMGTLNTDLTSTHESSDSQQDEDIYINSTGNGSVVSGRDSDGKQCTYVTAGDQTLSTCD